MANISQGQLRALIDQMVEQAIGEKMGIRQASWQSERPRAYAQLFKDNWNNTRKMGSSASNLMSIGSNFRSIGYDMQKLAGVSGDEGLDRSGRGFANFGAIINGIGGLQNAYQNKDPLGGATSGFQIGTSLGSIFKSPALGWWGMGIGLLMGLFGKPKKIDEWQKPKFKKAETAYNKLFTVDRGEEDLYYMPESFYFRTGWQGTQNIVVKVGNGQFDNHIRESLTSSYATQLQRGLVF